MMPTDNHSLVDLKEYIRDTLGMEISRLAKSVDEQSRVVKDIEIRTTSRTAELQKDVNSLYEENNSLKKAIEDVRRALDQEESTRQFLSNENRNLISSLRNEQVAKWEAQITINESIKSLRSVMWLILSIVVGILITAVWQMIIGGGVGALIK